MSVDQVMQPAGRRRVGLACNDDIRRRYIDPADIARLELAADFEYRRFSEPSTFGRRAPHDSDAEAELARFAAELDVLIVCEGAPYVSAEVLAAAPRLGLLGELEGDRFGYGIDVAAAHRLGKFAVDVSHGSSWPTAEWALALALVGRRNAGELFRTMIAHKPSVRYPELSGIGYHAAELSNRRVGMVGFGHVARHLTRLLGPFHVQIRAFDPFAPRELAEAYGVDFGPLHSILGSEVVFVLVPHTPSTHRMLGAAELEQLQPGSVLVCVSRGKVIDSAALLERLSRGDVVGCLDVFDPEPIPLDSPIRDLPNVFLTPHIAGVTEESRRRFFSLMVDECLRFFDGLEPQAQLLPTNVRTGVTSD
jgi:phosphoglycerate dehydrogenase-like enzyme